MKQSVLIIALLAFFTATSRDLSTVKPEFKTSNSVQAGDTPLTAKLIDFAGSISNSKVILNWSVGNNQQIQLFEIERSTNGVDFKTAALAFTTEKNGDDIYAYFEKIPTAKAYYRLKLIDKNNTVTYSNVLEFSKN